jgi:hypothetical protein
MSDRPSAANGKRNASWGTRHSCPACGQCLCFGCHPAGPCEDDGVSIDSRSETCFSMGFGTSSAGAFDGAWFASGASPGTGVAGLRLHGANAGNERERLR